jgi:hypothetical protein
VTIVLSFVFIGLSFVMFDCGSTLLFGALGVGRHFSLDFFGADENELNRPPRGFRA